MHRFKNAIEALALKPSRKLVLLVAILGLLCGLILTGGSLIVALSNQIIMMESSLSYRRFTTLDGLPQMQTERGRRGRTRRTRCSCARPKRGPTRRA